MLELCSAGCVRRLFAFSVLVLIASSVGQRYLGHVLGSPDLDFYDYYFAAQIVHENPHAALYQGATPGNPQLKSAPSGSDLARHAAQAGLSDTELYLYPPLLADLLQPVTRLAPHSCALLWRAFNLGLVLLSAVLLAGFLRIPKMSFEFLCLLVCGYAFWPVHEGVSLGQISLVILALWTIGVVNYQKEMVALSAIAFAIATALKVTPILLLPLFLIVWKDWRWTSWYVGTLACLIAGMFFYNGVDTLRTYVRVMQSMSGLVPAMQNKSISSLVAWMYYQRLFTLQTVHAVLDNPSNGVMLAAKVISFGFYAASLFMAWRRVPRFQNRSERGMLLATFALVTSVISPVSWRHGYSIAFIPLVFMWSDALRTGATRLKLALLTCTTISVGSLAFDLAAQLPLPELLKIGAASVWVLVVCGLCIETLRPTRHAFETCIRPFTRTSTSAV